MANNTTFTTVGNTDRPMRPKSRLAASRSMERPSLPRLRGAASGLHAALLRLRQRDRPHQGRVVRGMTADTCVKTAAAGTGPLKPRTKGITVCDSDGTPTPKAATSRFRRTRPLRRSLPARPGGGLPIG